MANRLTMAEVHGIEQLAAQGWSQRRITEALDIDRHLGRADRDQLPGDELGTALAWLFFWLVWLAHRWLQRAGGRPHAAG